MPRTGDPIDVCEHCGAKFYKEGALKLHAEVCDKDPANVQALERTGLWWLKNSLSEEEIARRQAEKVKIDPVYHQEALFSSYDRMYADMRKEEPRSATRADARIAARPDGQTTLQ